MPLNINHYHPQKNSHSCRVTQGSQRFYLFWAPQGSQATRTGKTTLTMWSGKHIRIYFAQNIAYLILHDNKYRVMMKRIRPWHLLLEREYCQKLLTISKHHKTHLVCDTIAWGFFFTKPSFCVYYSTTPTTNVSISGVIQCFGVIWYSWQILPTNWLSCAGAAPLPLLYSFCCGKDVSWSLKF